MKHFIVLGLGVVTACGQLKDLENESSNGGASQQAQCEALATGTPCLDAVTSLQSDVNTLVDQVTALEAAVSAGTVFNDVNPSNAADCNSTTAGSLRWLNDEWQGCDGANWRSIMLTSSLTSVLMDGNVSCVNTDELFSGGSTETVTVEAWFKTENLVNTSQTAQALFSHRANYNDIALTYDNRDPNNPFINWAFCGTGACNDILHYDVNLTDHAWHHVAGTFENSTLAIWLDGIEVASRQASGPMMYWGQSMWNTVGCDLNQNQMLLGQLREVRISRTARYTSAFSPPWLLGEDADTEALWHFNEGTGQGIADSTGKHPGRGNDLRWTVAP